MIDDLRIAVDYRTLTNDNELTFAGLLHRHFYEVDKDGNNVGISGIRKWSETTIATYKRDYETRLLPVLTETGKDKPMHSYTEEDYEDCLSKLREKHHYSDATVAHYRWLIWVAYSFAVSNGYFDKSFDWEYSFDPLAQSSDKLEEWRVKALTRTRKSFSIIEELKIVDWIESLDPTSASGEEIGLVLMFAMGLRNNEACGGDYSSVHPLEKHDDTIVFDMLQTTKLRSSETKSGGKTKNAPRVLILFPPVYDFLKRRKEYIQSRINNGTIVLPDNITSIDQLPIVNKGTDFLLRAKTIDLIEAGHTLFNKIGIDKSELMVLYQILCTSEFEAIGVEEKEPTTYLFRRNCATHLYQLGFSAEDIQYWMGHEIEDLSMKRSFYADPEEIYRLSQRFRYHPIMACMNSFGSTEKPSDIGASFFVRHKNDGVFPVSLSPGEKAFFRFQAYEPTDQIKLHIDTDLPLDMKLIAYEHEIDYGDTVTVLKQQIEVYQRKYRKLAKKH